VNCDPELERGISLLVRRTQSHETGVQASGPQPSIDGLTQIATL